MLTSESIINKKQNGLNLSEDEIEFIVNDYTDGEISDDFMTLWLKAVFDNGMDYEETLNYTQSMLNSGLKLDFSYLNGFIIDKHSTGGVGDKVSLILGPILAACGLSVPMLAGRGLEHTGGTIDKLESIPKYETSLEINDFKKIVENVGVSIMSQTKEICPADQKIYALRDITNTVTSFPLICGSIMSKKIAEGIQGLVLDIKIGNGAFMQTLTKGKKLGLLLKKVGNLHGIDVVPCYTSMNQPLGKSAGLWCEVQESIECLKGEGPEDLMDVVFHLAKHALYLSGIKDSFEKINMVIKNGSALDKFYQMVQAHGGLIKSLDDPEVNKPLFKKKVNALKSGYISLMHTKDIGFALVDLCGGHGKIKDELDSTAGIIFHKKIGESVHEGEILFEYFCSDKDKFNRCKLFLNESIEIQTNKIQFNKLIYS